MRKLSLLLMPLLVIELIADVPFTQAQNRGEGISERSVPARGKGHRGWSRRDSVERMREQLDLSEEQVQKIRAIMGEAGKKSAKLTADLRVAQIELDELVTQKKVDRGKIDAKVDEIVRLRQNRLRLRADMALRIREGFTPEQLAEADIWLKRLLRGRSRHGRYGRKQKRHPSR